MRLRDLPGVPVQGLLPLVGRVAAGNPILAAENIEAQYRIDAALFTPRADYLLRVKGASMQDAGILDGDLLVVHKTEDARSGQIVVARLGEEVTVKRLKRRGREITLLAENASFAPIVVDPKKTPFAIEGVAVGVIRPSRSLFHSA
jgi:repressor LexA